MNTNTSAIRSIIRPLLFWVVFILFLFLVSSTTGSFFPAQWHNWIYGVTGTLVAFITTWIFIKYEKKPFADFGLIWEKKTLLRFFTGLLIGSLLLGLVLFVLLAFTDLEISKSNKPVSSAALFGYLAFIPLGLFEEIAFRAYPFLKLNKAFGLRITQIIVAIAFALYHIISGWDVQVALLGPGAWAFVFGLAAAWSGGIAVPLGIHVALNILQTVTGLKGEQDAVWILNYGVDATEKITGRTEIVGIAIQLFILVAGVVCTEYYIRKKKHAS